MSRCALVVPVLLAIVLTQCAAPANEAQREGAFDPLRDSLSRDEPQPIYHSERTHPWNRLFHLLFTRTVRTRVLDLDEAPLFMAGDPRLAVNGPFVTRIESGDRAIDPLYSSWIWMGSTEFDVSAEGRWGVLKDPLYARLAELLEAVPASAASQPPLARALMQADLWATYDLLHATVRDRAGLTADAAGRRERTERLLSLLAHAIRALALSRSEISALPDTYEGARRAHELPDLFNPTSGWMEIRWFPMRMHEHAVDSRRAARVFLKPARRPEDEQAFLNRFETAHGGHAEPLEAAALLIQTLLISSDGSIVPSPITYEVQIRRFDPERSKVGPRVVQYELSRQQLLQAPDSGGFTMLDEEAPVYLPIAGNDFSFATRPAQDAEPLLVPLRQRCQSCHDTNFDRLITFAMTTAPDRPAPAVERLDPSENRHAREVAERKMRLENWGALQLEIRRGRR